METLVAKTWESVYLPSTLAADIFKSLDKSSAGIVFWALNCRHWPQWQLWRSQTGWNLLSLSSLEHEKDSFRPLSLTETDMEECVSRVVHILVVAGTDITGWNSRSRIYEALRPATNRPRSQRNDDMLDGCEELGVGIGRAVRREGGHQWRSTSCTIIRCVSTAYKPLFVP